MKICAVIAEYNPFQNGHLFHLMKAKEETACDALVVLMSGSFSSRGNICVADKFTRAEWAVAAGADIVLEIPSVYTLSSTENFAYGAMKTLKPFGKFTLSFGSDCGDIDSLGNAAERISNEKKDFSTMFGKFLNDGKNKNGGAENLCMYCAESAEESRDAWNAKLIETARKLNMSVDFHTVKRFCSLNSQNFVSTADIRRKIKEREDFSKSVPPFVGEIWPYDGKKFDALCLYALNSLSTEELAEINNMPDGFAPRLKQSIFTSVSEIYALASKQNPKSNIKRLLACCALDITKADFETAAASKPYYSILKLKEGRDYVLDYLKTLSRNVFFEKDSLPAKNKLSAIAEIDKKAAKLLSLVK